MNKYELCLELAKQAIAAKERRDWLPDDILDPEDVEALSNGVLIRRARAEFRSLPGNPHTRILNIPLSPSNENMDVPRDAMVQLLKSTLQPHSPTKRQQEALQAEIEALQADKTPTTYIAQKLDINRHSAYKLLKRAKMETFPEKVAVNGEGIVPDKWSPSRQAIEKMMASRQRVCAYCGQLSWASTKRICHKCYQFSISKPEEWRERTMVILEGQEEPWFIQEVRRIKNAHYRWAVNELYKAHYGTVSPQEYDNLVNAA